MSVTTIEWTKRPGTIGETWNPTTGCNKVDRGCKNCYAEIMHRRLQAMGQEKYQQPFLAGAKIQPDTLDIPLQWKRPRTVFVNSMSDLFHKDVPFEFIDRVFKVIRQTPQHTYLVLTKRPEIAVEFWKWQMRFNIGQPWLDPPPNLWMGTSANDQESAVIRIPKLMQLTGVLTFLSYEPATGPIDISNGALKDAYNFPTRYDDRGHGIEWADPGPAYIGLNWVIAGGESGPKAVHADPAWFRSLRDQCVNGDVPFFFKQWGLWQPFDFTPEPGRKYSVKRFVDGRTPMYKSRDKSFSLLDGEHWQQFPKPINLP